MTFPIPFYKLSEEVIYIVLKFLTILDFGYSTVTLVVVCKQCYRRMPQFDGHVIYVQNKQ